jgi:hypothetical protein
MLIHCLTLVFKDSASSADVEAFRAALADLPARLPFAIRTRQGPDLGVRPTNADYAVVTEFERAEDFAAYLAHPAHLAVPRDHVATVQSVQFELDEPF